MTPLFIVLGIIAAFVVLVAMRPKEFKIERSTAVAAPPSVLFEQVNDFHKWSKWSPWAKIDPAMKVTFGGAKAGTGATYVWAGNAKAGEGRMEIVESRPHDKIKILLDFLKPVRASNVTEFRFERNSQGTVVSWCMAGKRNFGMKAADLILNMDKMVGRDFERGLEALKSLAEAEVAKAERSVETTTAEPQLIA